MPEPHIAPATLFEFARLQSGLDTDKQAHLDACPECQKKLGWMRTMDSMRRNEPDYEPPGGVLKRAISIGSTPPTTAHSSAGRIIADLVYDSFSDPHPAGVRQEDLASRHLTFKADDLELKLQLTVSGEGRLLVVGQVVSENAIPAGVEVILDAEEEGARRTVTNEWGEFLFDDLSRAGYSLRVNLRERILFVPNLPLF